jgi:hypothetical protein
MADQRSHRDGGAVGGTILRMCRDRRVHAIFALQRRARKWRASAVALVFLGVLVAAPAAYAQSSGAGFKGTNHRGIEINASKQYAQGGIGTNGMAVYDGGYVDYRPYVGDGHGHIIGAGLFKGYYAYDNCILDTVDPTYYIESTDNSGATCNEYNGGGIGGYSGVTIYNTSGHTWSVGIGTAAATVTWPLTDVSEGASTDLSYGGNLACDYAKSLQWFDSSGGLHQGWKDNISTATISQTKPPYAYFVDKPGYAGYPSWLRMYGPADESSCF